MKQHGWGRIINISSIHGVVASPYKSAYVSSSVGKILGSQFVHLRDYAFDLVDLFTVLS
jgi:3-hydroxybutyrate dehydrogenase